MSRAAEAGRRRVLASALAGVFGAATACPARAQTQKLAQNVVLYQDHPKDGANCGGCANYQPPAACAVVAGLIAAQGWCVAFVPKSE